MENTLFAKHNISESLRLMLEASNKADWSKVRILAVNIRDSCDIILDAQHRTEFTERMAKKSG